MFSESTIQRRLRLLKKEELENLQKLNFNKGRNSSQEYIQVLESKATILEARIEELTWVLSKSKK